MPRLIVTLALFLAGCAAYDPPVVGDRSNVKYQTDIERCRKQAATAASRKANATPQSAIMAMFDSGDQRRKDVVTCMQARGYALRS